MSQELSAGVPVSHVGVSVPDIDAAISWYTDVLGFTLLAGPVLVDDDSPMAETARDIYGPRWHSMRQAHLSTSNGVGLELFQFLRPAETPVDHQFEPWHPGLFHFCVFSRDIDKLVQRIVDNGGAQSTKIHRLARYSMVYCRDPWGNALELNDCSYEQAHAEQSEQSHR
jgi:catechol 2,3-dioxygenase-like lactoylglutathione lyase family enzyme